MASAKQRIPTYHVVPRFDIAAKGGPLLLGSPLRNLQTLKPIGRSPVAVPEALLYEPVTQTGFNETRASLREGQFGTWAKVIGQGVGGSAKVAHKKDSEETVSCESLVTTYFDPDPDYVKQSLNTQSVQDYLTGSGYKAEVFLITGLKVAKQLSFGETRSKQNSGEVSVSVEPGAVVPVEAGVDGSLSRGRSYSLKFDTGDVVVGYRVTRYRYKPVSILPWKKGKKLVEDDVLEGAEMYGDEADDEDERPVYEFEEIPIDEDGTYERLVATAGGHHEYVTYQPVNHD